MKYILSIALALALPAAAAVGATPPPVEAFFKRPAINSPSISPSGRYLAMTITNQGTGRYVLAVYDTETRKTNVVGSFENRDVAQHQWVNDHRLLFNSRDMKSGPGDFDYGPGLWAVNVDGSVPRQLVTLGYQGGSAAKLLAANHYMFAPAGKQDSDWVYIRTNDHGTRLIRLNTVNGHTEGVSRPSDANEFVLGPDGTPRFVSTFSDNDSIVGIYMREGDSEEWKKLTSFDAYAYGKDSFTPLRAAEGGKLYVTSNRGQDKAAVYLYDIASGKMDEQPLISLPGYDFTGSLITRAGKVIGVRYQNDAEGTTWLDPSYKALQEEIDKLLPATINNLSFPRSKDSPNVLVNSYSDVQPAVAFLYNRQSKKLEPVAEAYPHIKPAEMGHQDPVRYTARDGLEIPAQLTLPANSTGKKLPLVVLVHGGPYVRGNRWGWNPQTQFLASRGYAVLEPEFRGSTGYGSKHFKAGWKQWGLKMQDDIADGAKWAIAQGIADPNRICIAGASYGGYATLMGLVNDHELYKCGINWVGVTDIGLMYSKHWRFADDLGSSWRKYGMPEMVGDKVKDAAQLKATSPVEQAARIKRPLLLAYGAADVRVPLIHGLKFRDAVTQTNKDVEWVQYEEEAHGWALPKNQVDFWSRVERFLERNIGNGAAK